jgi:hypothetical protein
MNKIQRFSKVFKVGKRLVGEGAQTLIIADAR